MDWKAWHEKYDDPASPLTRRLRVVQGLVREALDLSPPGPLRVISLCSGQGRDLLEVLTDHPRREDVRARLVELDERNTALAMAAARDSGLSQVEIVTADASRSENYDGMTPADLVLICGLFGNIGDADIERVVATCPQLCKTGGRVVWTRKSSGAGPSQADLRVVRRARLRAGLAVRRDLRVRRWHASLCRDARTTGPWPKPVLVRRI
jgi:hypothetical protein